MTKSLAIALLLVSMSAGSSVAADPSSRNIRASSPVLVDEFHPFQIRLKATVIRPDGKTKLYDRDGLILPAAGYSFGAGSQVFDAGAKVSTSIIPELDFTYFLTRNISVETLCCATRHKVTGAGSFAGWNVGRTWMLPATVLPQYHFTNFGAFQPYVGVGVHYDIFTGMKAAKSYTPFYSPALSGIVGSAAFSSLSIKNSWGVVTQVGFDYMLNQNWGINVDVKRYLLRSKVSATVRHSMLGSVPVTAKVNIDPWLVSAGITYRFGGPSAD